MISGKNGMRYVVRTGRPAYAINISSERCIRRSHKVTEFFWWARIEETCVYEMACDTPRTDDNVFGTGEYYAEEETTGAWWLMRQKNVDSFLKKEFYS